jgi:hypothetical protein
VRRGAGLEGSAAEHVRACGFDGARQFERLLVSFDGAGTGDYDWSRAADGDVTDMDDARFRVAEFKWMRLAADVGTNFEKISCGCCACDVHGIPLPCRSGWLRGERERWIRAHVLNGVENLAPC